MCYCVNTSYIWNHSHSFTPRFNNIKWTKFLFFYVFYRNLKEIDHINGNINSKKRNVYARNQYYYLGLPKIRVGRARTTKNSVAFASPYICWKFFWKIRIDKYEQNGSRNIPPGNSHPWNSPWKISPRKFLPEIFPPIPLSFFT